MINKIDECPFCGSTATANPTMIEPGWWVCSIICNGCPAQIINSGNTKEEAINNAIKSWNKRMKAINELF